MERIRREANIEKVRNHRRLLFALGALLTSALFALQTWFYKFTTFGDGPFLLIVFLSTLLISAISGRFFYNKPVFAGAASCMIAGLFACGEISTNTAISALVGGHISWWSEQVIGEIYLLAIPAAVVAFAMGFYCAGRQQLEIDRERD